MSYITLDVQKYLNLANINGYDFANIIDLFPTVIYKHAKGAAMEEITLNRYIDAFASLGVIIEQRYSPIDITIKFRVLRELKGLTQLDVAKACDTIKQNIQHIETNVYVDQDLIVKMLAVYGHTVDSYNALDINAEIVLRNDWYDKVLNIGTTLRALRQASCCSAKELSEAFKWHASAISEIERNRNTADIDRVIEYVELFMSVKEFNSYRARHTN